uniref:Uncharacterized protein n=1 Tax=Acrobeloides nanus TaxID=290746 RepID=A0A914DMJ6_9BILA
PMELETTRINEDLDVMDEDLVDYEDHEVFHLSDEEYM